MFSVFIAKSDIAHLPSAILILTVGKFEIKIEMDRNCEQLFNENVVDMVFGASGVKAVLNIQMREINHREVSRHFQNALKEIYSRFRLPQKLCFGKEKEVPATLNNFVKALRWCQSNQNFMKKGKGN